MKHTHDISDLLSYGGFKPAYGMNAYAQKEDGYALDFKVYSTKASDNYR